jgi:integrase
MSDRSRRLDLFLLCRPGAPFHPVIDHDWGLVFRTPRGTPLHPEGPREGLKKALQRAGLDPDVRFHDLRHTAATERYAHVLADSRRRIAESMERLLATDE